MLTLMVSISHVICSNIGNDGIKSFFKMFKLFVPSKGTHQNKKSKKYINAKGLNSQGKKTKKSGPPSQC